MNIYKVERMDISGNGTYGTTNYKSYGYFATEKLAEKKLKEIEEKLPNARVYIAILEVEEEVRG